MRNLCSALLLVLAVSNPFARQAAASDEHAPSYEMRGASTYLAPYDTEYGVSQIDLVRTARTAKLHWVDFTINRTERVCTYWERRCVQYDNMGRCIRWERVCVSWYDRSEPVDKRIQINFSGLTPLSDDQMEVYQLDITRYRPNQDGEDPIRTWLTDESVLQPVRVRRWGNFDYRVDPK